MSRVTTFTQDLAKQPSNRGIGLGFATVAVWIITTFAMFRTRSINDLLGGNAVDGQVAFQVVSWGLLGLLAVSCVLSGRVDLNLLRRGPVAWYLAFTCLALASTLYSVNPAFTFFYAAQNLTLILLVCSMGHRLDAIYRLIVLYVGINWMLLLLGTLGITFGLEWITTAEESYIRFGGSPGEMWRFSTAFGHPSLLSIVAAIGAVGIATSDGALRLRRLLVVWLAITVILTLSRTAIAGMAAGFVIVAIRRGTVSLATTVVFLSLSAALCMPGFDNQLTAVLMRGQSSDEFNSLTGRSEIYSVALQRISESWLGDGFRSLRGRPLLGEQWGQGVSHAHNLVLQAVIDLGYAGAFTVLMTLGTLGAYALSLAWPRLRGGATNRLDFETLAIFFPVLAFCTLDSGFAVNVNAFVVVFVVICARARWKVLTGNIGYEGHGHDLHSGGSIARQRGRKWLR